MTTITLSDGRAVEIRKGKGRDAMEAQKISGKDMGMFFPALMSQLVTIDGKAQPAEYYLDELELQDYLTLMGELAGSNFTLPVGN